MQDLSRSKPVLTSARPLPKTWTPNSVPYGCVPLVLPTQPSLELQGGYCMHSTTAELDILLSESHFASKISTSTVEGIHAIG